MKISICFGCACALMVLVRHEDRLRHPRRLRCFGFASRSSLTGRGRMRVADVSRVPAVLASPRLLREGVGISRFDPTNHFLSTSGAMATKLRIGPVRKHFRQHSANVTYTCCGADRRPTNFHYRCLRISSEIEKVGQYKAVSPALPPVYAHGFHSLVNSLQNA